MTRKEMQEVSRQMLGIYSGILFHNSRFAQGNAEEIRYEFDRPEFTQLRECYELEKIAGKGSDFVRAKRLLHYLAPRLTHSSWYDNHIECNALRLLEYSLNNPQQGINCLNKSKILQECCMAVGIYARRVRIMPYSPYDFDNHVVTEIYDRKQKKWIMLDPTTDGYFIDENKVPLSLLQMREKFASAGFVTFVRTTDTLGDICRLREKYVDTNAYICKNLCYFTTEKVATFGVASETLLFVPEQYSVKNSNIANIKYRIENLLDAYAEIKSGLEERLRRTQEQEQPQITDIQFFKKSPC